MRAGVSPIAVAWLLALAGMSGCAINPVPTPGGLTVQTKGNETDRSAADAMPPTGGVVTDAAADSQWSGTIDDSPSADALAYPDAADPTATDASEDVTPVAG